MQKEPEFSAIPDLSEQATRLREMNFIDSIANKIDLHHMEAEDVRGAIYQPLYAYIEKQTGGVDMRYFLSSIAKYKALGREHSLKGDIITAIMLRFPFISNESEGQLKEQVNKNISGYGLDPEKLHAQWAKTLTFKKGITLEELKEMRENWVIENVITLPLLEGRFSEEDHVAQTLHNEFGIHNFANRTVEDWVAQYKEKDIPGPWLAEMLSLDDPNGANTYKKKRRYLITAQEDLTNKLPVRQMDADGHTDALQLAIRLRRKYGRVFVPLLHMHSAPGYFIIGGRKRNQMVYREDIEAVGKLLKMLVAEDAPVVLNMCSSGRSEDSIGQSFARAFQRIVIAPVADAALHTLQFKQVDGKYGIDISYIDASTQKPVQARRFYPDGTSVIIG